MTIRGYDAQRFLPSLANSNTANQASVNHAAAYRTPHSLPSNRIGLSGLFGNVNASHVWKHLKSHPLRVAQGVAQLAVGIVLSSIPGLGYLT